MKEIKWHHENEGRYTEVTDLENEADEIGQEACSKDRLKHTAKWAICSF